MTQPSKSEVDAVLERMEKQPRTRRLPPLQSMTWSEDEKSRLRTYCAQMTRYRLQRWWRRLLARRMT